MTASEPATAPELAIVADDLTGAMDAAAPFAAAGKRTTLWLGDGPATTTTIVAITTETRDLPPATAVAAARRAAAALAATTNPNAWYKKIDSALRGHPGREIAALAAVVGARRLLVAPALPSEGRTVRGGRVFVDGRPLAASSLGAGHVDESAAARLGGESGLPVETISLATVRGPAAALHAVLNDGPPAILLADTETEADLAALATATRAARLPLCCGSAGLARHLAGSPASPAPWRIAPSGRPTLVIAGSRHEATARQLAHARGHADLRLIPLPRLDDLCGDVSATAAEAATALRAGRDVAVTTTGAAPSLLAGADVAALLGRVASDPGVSAAAGALILTGGDVAAAVCRALGCTRIDVLGEAAPNIPLGLVVRAGRPPLPVVTKAGSFGQADAITRCLGLLREGRATT
ncbi:MAG TPA: four-carbon acid sugar kinase family protein [Thermomicrobiales bacterium]|nr:four-carbon acid sugar kinase family protein [Thermomicrobiales bacterium]